MAAIALPGAQGAARSHPRRTPSDRASPVHSGVRSLSASVLQPLLLQRPLLLQPVRLLAGNLNAQQILLNARKKCNGCPDALNGEIHECGMLTAKDIAVGDHKARKTM